MAITNNPANFRFPTLQSCRESLKPKTCSCRWNQLVLSATDPKPLTEYRYGYNMNSTHTYRDPGNTRGFHGYHGTCVYNKLSALALLGGEVCIAPEMSETRANLNPSQYRINTGIPVAWSICCTCCPICNRRLKQWFCAGNGNGSTTGRTKASKTVRIVCATP